MFTNQLSSKNFFQRTLPVVPFLCALSLLAACGASGADYGSARSPSHQPASQGNYKDGSPPPPPAATTMATDSEVKAGAPSTNEIPQDRPGLATHWGENRTSTIRTTTFFRADFDSPMAAGKMFYNNESGARAMAQSRGFSSRGTSAISFASGGVTAELHDNGGNLLPAYVHGQDVFAIGQTGARYSITLVNHTPARFEVILSVDGLDVLDGKESSFSKRGYLLNPHSSLEVEGFRRSTSTVAAFRFGNVSGSYASRSTGKDQNVGVVGIALFHERGFEPWPWRNHNDTNQRNNANPFPGQFARPPQ
jgi:hypothetical protein